MPRTQQILPITHRIRAERQEAKRHYGVHPYFTRRPANVVRAYIKHFTKPGESVLDPFGGSGVTAIEAMLLNRLGIHNDINPLANFIAAQVADTSYEDTTYIEDAFLQVQGQCRAQVESVSSLSDTEATCKISGLHLPANIKLPRSSDARDYYDLFSPRQLVALALLKTAIDHVPDAGARGALLLAWSATLGKLNRTFLSTKGRLESRGGSSIFSIYRYKLARSVVELRPWEVFRERVANVIEGKREVIKQKRLWEQTHGWQGSFELYHVDISDLPAALGRKVDYIFTDPPYGGHIAYLDLSILWNHWLGFDVPLSDRRREIIVGGALALTEEHYIKRLRESIRSCLSMLNRSRWLSVVFQHWNVRYFEAILEEAALGGASLKAAVTQIGDTIWSMHKKKNKESVLAGEVILSFIKDGEGAPRHRGRPDRITAEGLVNEAIEEISPDGRPFPGELLFNRIVLRAWERGTLETLDITQKDFIELLKKRGWRYDPNRHEWIGAIEPANSNFQLAL